MLDISRVYSENNRSYSSDCRRNIKISKKSNHTIDNDIRSKELLAHFSQNKGKEIKGIKRTDYKRLSKLMDFCTSNSSGKIIGVKADGRLVYGVFLVLVKKSLVLLFTSTSKESYESRTGYFFIDNLIKEYSERYRCLDFAGSSLKGISDFIRSFGASCVPYYRLYRNNLPWPVRLFK
jgi:hypothetical protein